MTVRTDNDVQEPSSFFNRNHILPWTCAVIFLLAIVKIAAYADWLTIVSTAVVGILWLAQGGIWVQFFDSDKQEIANASLRPYFDFFTRCLQVLTCFMLAQQFVVAMSPSGVWVARDGRTTLSTRFLVFVPIVQAPEFVPWVVYAHGSRDPRPFVSVRTETTDGVEISCSVGYTGISFRREDPVALEQFLTNLGFSSDSVLEKVEGRLSVAFQQTALRVLSQKSAAEIERGGHLLIPYQIGTPMGDALQELFLRWSGASIVYNCSPHLDG